jgi:hypothetical protein
MGSLLSTRCQSLFVVDSTPLTESLSGNGTMAAMAFPFLLHINPTDRPGCAGLFGQLSTASVGRSLSVLAGL